MAASRKGGLGRGLDALFADAVPASRDEINKIKKGSDKDNVTESDVEVVKYLSIHDVKPNSDQPRKTFNEDKIIELADSIRENGIIQPIIVRKKGRSYEIVAGERRWRAAIKADLKEIPCIVRKLSDEQNMLLAIIENMQREDLNPLEEAEGLNRMIITYGLTQEQVSRSVGKSRPYIANSLRLLKLPEDIRELISDGSLTAGHGRALLGLDNDKLRTALADKIVRQGLSVRETERLVSEAGKPKQGKASRKVKNPDLFRVEEDLKEALGTRVQIKHNGKKGKIEIEFFSRDELERLIDMLESLGA